jgi:hypothetical protein
MSVGSSVKPYAIGREKYPTSRMMGSEKGCKDRTVLRRSQREVEAEYRGCQSY